MVGNLNERDWAEWARHPVTQAHLQTLRDSKQETMEAWARESFIGKSIEETAVENATALGGVRVLNDLIAAIEGMMEEEGKEQ